MEVGNSQEQSVLSLATPPLVLRTPANKGGGSSSVPILTKICTWDYQDLRILENKGVFKGGSLEIGPIIRGILWLT